MEEFPGESFTIVAARGADDVWAEIRRERLIPVRARRRCSNSTWRRPSRSLRLRCSAAAGRSAAAARRSRSHRPRSPAADSEVPPAPSAAVLPMSRSPIRPDLPPPVERPPSSLDEWLRLAAAARGAAVLYLSSSTRPSIRVDGEIFTLEGAPRARARTTSSRCC